MSERHFELRGYQRKSTQSGKVPGQREVAGVQERVQKRPGSSNGQHALSYKIGKVEDYSSARVIH